MLSSFRIQNFKSIVDQTIELGKFNVFIGENGCGKSNILEAFAMAAAALTGKLTNEELYARGIRVAKPSLMRGAFIDPASRNEIKLAATILVDGHPTLAEVLLTEPYADTLPQEVPKWLWDLFDDAIHQTHQSNRTKQAHSASQDIGKEMDVQLQAALLQKMANVPAEQLRERQARSATTVELRHFGIYAPSTLALRGLQTESRREPLGLFGEGLDTCIAGFSETQLSTLHTYAKLIAWVDTFDIDPQGTRKREDYKLGRSSSELYFHDKFMVEGNRMFSAENANEGVLHILFHVALFLSDKTPKIFAIDNIETALNPHLLRQLIKSLAQLAVENDKQALITTHNPAALDGLNLHDENQRLFVVARNDEGHTTIRRVKMKPEQKSGEKLKLSEMWMRGMLGAIPTHF